MTDEQNAQTTQPPQPYPGLRQLDKLVGTWKITGPDIEGETTYEWMDGGFFLLQRVNLNHAGHITRGLEIIGYTKEFGSEAPSEHIKSRYYGGQGDTLDYVYEVDDETLTIWGGEKGSPAFYRGQWSADGNTNSGAWQWPGGGYESTMTRIK